MNAPLELNVYQRLNNARSQFHSLKLKKTGHNKFAGYYYFELGDFLIPALQVFADNGLFANVSFGVDVALMNIRNVDKPDEFIQIISPMAAAELKGCHPIQNLGAVQTYQRRYLWVAALEIVEHDAIDASEPVKEKPLPAPITPTTGAWERMSQDEQTFLTDLAMEVADILSTKGAAAAVKHIDAANLDADEKVALWTRFDSKQRSAMKKAKQDAELAGQA